MRISDTSEKSIEDIIEAHLASASSGYRIVSSTDYHKEHCMIPRLLWEFIEKTQPQAFEKLQKRSPEKFLRRVYLQIKEKGIIEVLRKGVKDLDLTVKLYYKAPASHLSKKTQRHYEANIFSVTRQLYYSGKNKNSLDMAIFINGLPILTIELKNQLTRQTVQNAIRQYKRDRDPREPLFQFSRCMVHFAVDDELIYMSTHLKGEDSFFLPFNRGLSDGSPDKTIKQGAGNPLNPKGIKTAFLWEEIFQKDSLSKIIENYAQVVTETDEDTKKKSRKLIFPRYHQLKCVENLLAHAKVHGTNNRYLIQHSAGSGKSNSITWLAHQLVGLHHENNQNIFDSVIVVTDRRVLDKQIRDNIRQFAQVKGVVEAIEKGSKQLKTALEDGKKIIITTLQKFPHVVKEIGDLKGNRFAIIIDEAHSSQSGETAAKMNLALSGLAQEEQDDSEDFQVDYNMVADPGIPYGTFVENDEDPEHLDNEDFINAIVERRKMLKNASYFAFTATPKSKTLQTFGAQWADGKYYPFHLYSMKQAIEEGFILDVLNNYTTYNSYYKLNKVVEDNPYFDTHQAQKKLRAFVEGHPFSIAEKAKVMIDHFQREVRRQIKGKAKTMVVCKSIRSAIEYHKAFRLYLEEIQSPYKALIAFSGIKTIKGIDYDEAKMNGFPSSEIPKQFKKDIYRFLIVANKFQTGFDQPLLHTMYVDKKLAGVQAVQTLSRLNRSRKDKDSTFVLDFYNDAEKVQEAFETYYTSTILSEGTDPNKLNDLQEILDATQAYSEADVRLFTDLFFTEAPREELDPIIDRCKEYCREVLSDDELIDFIVKSKAFMRTYSFLSKLLSFRNAYWERLYWFLKYLTLKLRPPESEDLAKGILEAIDMDSYRLTRNTSGDITLSEEGGEIDPISAAAGGKRGEPELDALENIINMFNERFGLDGWSDDDKIRNFLFHQLPQEIEADGITTTTIQNSDKQNAKIASDKKVEDLMQDVIFQFTDLYKKFTDDPDFKRQYMAFVFDRLWKNAQASDQTLFK